MILANIGNSSFKLNTLNDAEFLLKILGDSVQIDSGYDNSESCNRYYYETSHQSRIQIEITGDEEIISYQEALDIRRKKQHKSENKED